MSKEFDVAVVGATGAVGETMLSILAERKFPIRNIYALASERSAGKRVEFGSKQLVVQDLAKFDFSQVLIGLFSPGASISKIYGFIINQDSFQIYLRRNCRKFKIFIIQFNQ